MSVDRTGTDLGAGRSILTEVPSTQQILGIRFFVGSTIEIVDFFLRTGGVLVVPAAPALVKLRHEDERYRRALTEADFAIADSGLMVLLWKLRGGKNVRRISGLKYLKCLVEDPDLRIFLNALLVLPSEVAKQKTLAWSRNENLPLDPDDCYVAPHYGAAAEDTGLLRKLESRRPAHVIIAIGNGPQEMLGVFLRNNLSYRPAIHCIGAALGFLTGDQITIPDWADRLYLGWFFRLVAQPSIFIPRLSRALELPWLIWKYGEKLPPMRGRV
ncbi:MAG: glycosyltransferase [Verrucomicrobia bacterium]|nr:MAG: glycosyltransferase [Verrucomicrobiota bacterium]PYJ31643.1 MAG: glycosyltransferase [Verrucomicrobiota bacterium]